MADRYTNFAVLSNEEKQDVDYRIWLKDRGTSIVVLAPHGGWIEPGSSEIAQAIARDDYSVYAFEGIRRGRQHRDLHITSTHFDEPLGVKLVTSAETTIAIHGRADGDDPQTVWVGGRDIAFRDVIASFLNAAGFATVAAEPELAGLGPANICNRGTSGGGVQLELPRTLRNELARDGARLGLFSGAVREAISDWLLP